MSILISGLQGTQHRALSCITLWTLSLEASDPAVIFSSQKSSFFATPELSQRTSNCRTSDLPHLSSFIDNFPQMRPLIYQNGVSSEFFSTISLRRAISEVLRKECTLRKSPLSWPCLWIPVLFVVSYLPSTQRVSGDSRREHMGSTCGRPWHHALWNCTGWEHGWPWANIHVGWVSGAGPCCTAHLGESPWHGDKIESKFCEHRIIPWSLCNLWWRPGKRNQNHIEWTSGL